MNDKAELPLGRLGFHEGSVLLKLSDTYPTLAKSLQEMVQNALDAKAKHILIRIDLKHREAVVMDDGSGITPKKFAQALDSVGESKKKTEAGKLGKFGLGLISPLKKADYFTVTSFPKGVSAPTMWTFRAKDIAAQKKDVDIPVATLARFIPETTNWGVKTTWRTTVKLYGITTDRAISAIDLESFEDELQANYNTAMLMHNTTVCLELTSADGKFEQRIIEPRKYKGDPLKVATYAGPDVGTVTFELYRTRVSGGKRAGKVSVRQVDDLFAIPWKDFVNQGRMWVGVLPFFDAIGSGYLEGIITAQNIQLAASRTKFEIGDPLLDLYSIIEKWYADHGQALLNDEKEKASSQRLQQLGLKSLERWKELLDDPAYAGLRDALLSAFTYGRLGSGHVMPDGGKPEGFEDRTSIRTGQGGAGTPKTPLDEKTPQRSASHEPHRPGDVPMTSRGPRGSARQLIKNDSIGLQLAHEPLDSTRPWELDEELGVLYFNTSHALWARVEKWDTWVLHFQEWVILQVLILLTMPLDRFEEYRALVDQQAASYVELFVTTLPKKKS